jgi:hypothetical protein
MGLLLSSRIMRGVPKAFGEYSQLFGEVAQFLEEFSQLSGELSQLFGKFFQSSAATSACDTVGIAISIAISNLNIFHLLIIS